MPNTSSLARARTPTLTIQKTPEPTNQPWSPSGCKNRVKISDVVEKIHHLLECLGLTIGACSGSAQKVTD